MRSLTCLALAAAFSAAAPTFSAAADAPSSGVEVTFTDAERFLDAGDSPRDRSITEDVLSRHLQSLGQRWLPPGDRLQIVVTDIDLAGRVNPFSRSTSPPRVMTGGADWPRITLHYTRTAADGTVSQREESVSDMSYLNHRPRGSEPLPYEKQMLTDWFRTRFAPPDASTAQAR